MGIHATGCAVRRGTTAGDGGTTIAALTDVTLNFSRDALETTAHDAASNTMTRVPGMIDPGTVTFKINYIADNASAIAAVKTDIADQTVVQWAVEFLDSSMDSSGAVFYGNAFVTDVSINAPVKGLVTADITLTCAGAWTRP